MNDCEKELFGPLGTIVGHCDRKHGHPGPCSVKGQTEQMMLDRLVKMTSPPKVQSR